MFSLQSMFLRERLFADNDEANLNRLDSDTLATQDNYRRIVHLLSEVSIDMIRGSHML